MKSDFQMSECCVYAQASQSQICNIYGQPLIQVSNLNTDINMIDVSALKKGLYFTSIYIDGKLTKTQKFVKE